MSGAAKVGAFVIAFVVLIYGAYAVLGRNLFKQERDRYFAVFEDAGGLGSGTKVLLAGVQIGQVDKVELINQPRAGKASARATLAIDPKIDVPAGTVAVIPGSLLSLGESALLLEPPTEDRGVLSPGATLAGRRAGALDAILPETKSTIQELNKTLVATRKLLEDEGLRKDIRTVLQTSSETLERFGELSSQTQGLIAENRVLIKQALTDASLAMRDVREGTKLIANLVKDGKVEKEILEMMDRLNATSARAESLVANVDRLLGDPEFQGSIKQTAKNAEKISDSGTRIAESTEKIAKNGEVVSSKAIELADNANALVNEAKSTLQDVRGFLGRGARTKSLPIQANMDVMRQQDPDYWRTDVEFSTGFLGSSYYLGLWDAFESNKLIVQLGRRAAPNLNFRYGIYAAKPGVGVDYRLSDRLAVRGDLFDINDPRLDLRTRLELGKGLYGWFGMDRIFDKNNPTVGIGFQK